VNTDAPWPTLEEAEARVLGIQIKLHRWATDSPDRRFCDLFNLVCDPAFLTVAWARVRGNRGARTAGVDGVKPADILFGTTTLLPMLRGDLKAGRFSPLPVRQVMIPKASGKLRRLGIPACACRECHPSHVSWTLTADAGRGEHPAVTLSFLYRAFWRVLQLIRLVARKDTDLAIEVVVLRHEVAVGASAAGLPANCRMSPVVPFAMPGRPAAERRSVRVVGG
jgi:RNA-directed DNA polymerase